MNEARKLNVFDRLAARASGVTGVQINEMKFKKLNKELIFYHRLID